MAFPFNEFVMQDFTHQTYTHTHNLNDSREENSNGPHNNEKKLKTFKK